jgi:ABC-type cobalt transport system substrate-binding protein
VVVVVVVVMLVVLVELSTAKWTGIDHCAKTDVMCSTTKWAARPIAMIGSVDSMGRLCFKLYTLRIVSSF